MVMFIMLDDDGNIIEPHKSVGMGKGIGPYTGPGYQKPKGGPKSFEKIIKHLEKQSSVKKRYGGAIMKKRGGTFKGTF